MGAILKNWAIRQALDYSKRTIILTLIITGIIGSGIRFIFVDDNVMNMLPKDIESRRIWYADYSHGIRFAHAQCRVNGEERSVSDVLKDPGLYHLLSDEDGPMIMPRYPVDKSSYP